ncbi:MAG: SEL1-like repeat protein [Bacteroidaceae bacterium]|nr:SEL1-like repeat protein [Bacteroidaceae bacterium]
MSKRLTTYIVASLLCFSAMAQSRIDSIAYRAIQVGHVMQQERVYLHFDNTAYYLSETMWFKAYTTFGTNDRPSTLSKVLYVELVAPEGYVVETKKYKLDDDGTCHGEFDLNPLLLSGYYEVRAYTRYMLNWGKEAVFTRVFPVFDKVNADNWDFKNMLDRRRGYNERGKWISSELPDATLDFFPEGGHLVEGIKNKVAFELRGQDGLFGEEKITILENDVKLLECTPLHEGKGVFEITPKANTKYRAEVTMIEEDGKTKKHKFSLPEVSKEGVVLNVTESGDDITITATNNLAEDCELGVVILYRGAMGFFKKFDSANKTMNYTIAKQELPEGVNRVVLFANEHTPLAERQFFITHDTIAASDRETVKLNVTANGYHTHNLSPKPGEKVTLKVTRDDGKPIQQGTSLSLSAIDAYGKQATSYSHNMYTYLLLGSELKGYIPNAAQYFDPKNSNRKKQLELLMLTHGWTSYNWHMLTRNKVEDMQPIERGISLKGKFYQKRRSTEFGSYGSAKLTPQTYNLTRVDIEGDSGRIETTTFRTDSIGGFMIEFDDFYGTRIAALRPQTTFKHSQNISYQFALDRYYSPDFRLYDYWERHLGEAMAKSTADSLVRMNPFEYMLSSVDVVEKRKKEINERPPHSEMRFNYLDEWEYAQDVTFINDFNTYEDEIYNNIKNDAIIYETPDDEDGESRILGVRTIVHDIGQIISIADTGRTMTKYIGNMRLGTDAFPITKMQEYDHVLTAADVVTSAMKRHNYNWAYWVQLMVVLGEYSPYTVPQPDKEYLRGLPDADKMTNFKEIVIRSDAKTREQFENRDTYWAPLSNMLDNKLAMQKFYLGFLSQMYLFAGGGIDGCPDGHRFDSALRNAGGGGINYPMNPNYVACLIPYEEGERERTIVPEFAATGSSLRYTSVQGYSESKEFYSPDYSRMQPQKDDYRRTLIWIPEIEINENGEAVVELYNTNNCNNIVVDVAGRNGTSLYSNDAITTTRLNGASEKKNAQPQAQQKNEQKVKTLSPEEEAVCAWEHEKGVIYFNKGNYRDAITIFAELVQYKYAPSMYYVSLCYRDGKGLKTDHAAAMKFLFEAARLGYGKAQYDLAIEFEKGDILERNDSLAHHWYEEAAASEEPRALYEMAQRYREGKNVAIDNAKSRELLSRAAELKEPNAMYEYAELMIAEGEDAYSYMKEAADLGNEKAMIYVFDKLDNQKRYDEAYKYAQALYLAGNHEGTRRVADYYLEGKCVSRDKHIAKELYYKAARDGNKIAKEKLRNL